MPYEYTYLEDRDLLAQFEQEQEDAALALSSVRAADLPDGAFNAFQIEDIVVDGRSAEESHAGGTHTYDATADTCAYTTYGLDGLTDRAVVGAPATGSYSGPSSQLTVSWNPTGTQACALVLANIEIKRAVELGTDDDEAVMFCVQVRQGGSWLTVEESERFFSFKDHYLVAQPSDLDSDFPIFTLLDEASLPGGAAAVTGVRLCIAIKSTSSSCEVTLDRWNMSFIPLLAEAG